MIKETNKMDIVYGVHKNQFCKYLPAPTTTIFWLKKSDNGRPWALTVPNNPASATPAVPYKEHEGRVNVKTSLKFSALTVYDISLSYLYIIIKHAKPFTITLQGFKRPLHLEILKLTKSAKSSSYKINKI